MVPLRRPFLLTLGAILATCFLTLWVIVLVAYALGAGGDVRIGEESIPREAFFARGGGWLLLLLGALGAAVAGLWLRRAWAREAMLAFWVAFALLCAALAPDRASVVGYGGFALFALAVAAAYLYGAPGVRAYFAALERRRQASEPPAV